MSKNFDWGQRLEAILTGALTTWRIDGKVGRNVSGKCTVETERTTITVARITDDGDTYWEVTPSETPARWPTLRKALPNCSLSR